MMRRLLFIGMLLFVSGVSTTSFAQDSIHSDLISRSLQKLSPRLQLLERNVDNPALRFYVWNVSYTEMSARVSDDKQDEAIIQQLGNRRQLYGLDISSLLAPNAHSRAWGRASYDHVKYSGINMNLTSDFDRVYPYITADTLGPAAQTGETYSFSGGYAQRLGHFHWGVGGSIRNQQEYRQLDPRPRNRVSDLKIDFGTGYRFHEAYVAAFSLGFDAYKQAHSISLLADEKLKKKTPLFSMTGLGTALSQTTNSGFTYVGQTWRFGIALYPALESGWMADINYASDHLDKTLGTSGGSLSSINNVRGSSAINDVLTLKEDRTQVRLGWISKTSPTNSNWGLIGNYVFRHRVGSEILMASMLYEGVATNTNLVNVGMVPYYRENIEQIGVEGTYEQGVKSQWHVKPYLSYVKSNARYLDPAREMGYERLRYGTQLGNIWVRPKALIQLLLNLGIDQGLSAHMDIENDFKDMQANMQLNYGHLNRFAKEVERSNYRFLSGSSSHLGGSLRCEWQLFNNKSLFLQPSYRQDWYRDQIKQNYYEVRVGLTL